MTDCVVASPHGVTLIGGGRVTPGDLDLALGLAPCLVAADKGADQALAAGHSPVAVIGDLDSLSDHARRVLADRLHHVPEQITTDFEKAITRIEAPFILAIGFSGARVDHLLATLTAISRHEGPPILMQTEKDVIFRAPARLRLDLPTDMRLSLYPMGRVRGRSEGLFWPIDGLDLAPDGVIGTSNQVTGPVLIESEGPLLVILPKSGLNAVLAAYAAPATG